MIINYISRRLNATIADEAFSGHFFTFPREKIYRSCVSASMNARGSIGGAKSDAKYKIKKKKRIKKEEQKVKKKKRTNHFIINLSTASGKRLSIVCAYASFI